LSSQTEILKPRYEAIEEALSIMNSIVGRDIAEVLSDSKVKMALRASILFYAQGILDLANIILATRDLTPKNHREIFEILIRAKIVDERYAGLLDELVVLRNKLLFLYSTVNIEYLYEFVRKNMDMMNELYHTMIRLCGSV